MIIDNHWNLRSTRRSSQSDLKFRLNSEKQKCKRNREWVSVIMADSAREPGILLKVSKHYNTNK